MHIDSHFDSGNIDVVELLDNNIANLRINKDAGDEHMQWFHFRVDGAKDKGVTLRIVNAGDASYPKAWNGYRVCTSVDRQTWTRVDTTFEDGVLTISGERKTEKHEDAEGVRRFERVSGRFYRRFTLPETADAESIAARSANGILEVSIPKLPEVQPRRITVEAA